MHVYGFGHLQIWYYFVKKKKHHVIFTHFVYREEDMLDMAVFLKENSRLGKLYKPSWLALRYQFVEMSFKKKALEPNSI